MAAGELVPDTPTSTARAAHESAQEDLHSQSYLLAAIGRGGARLPSSPGARTSDADSSLSEATQQRLSAIQAAAQAGDGEEDELELNQDEGDLSTVADSQMPPRARSPDGNTSRSRTNAALRRHGSQPALAPPKYDDGYLGETMAESLGETSWERDKSRRSSDRSGLSQAAAQDEDVLGDLNDETTTGEVSMDLTRADGRLLSRRVQKLADADDTVPSQQITEDSQSLRPTESQKENPSPLRATSRPASSAAFGSHSPQVNMHDGSGPSSSPAVARELLQRSPAKKAFVEEPASSADPDLSPSVLLSPARLAKLNAVSASAGDSLGVTQNDGSLGPETSTPAFANAPPPAPVTAARTLPNLELSLASDPPPAAVQAARPLARSATTGVDLSLFASSAAMKAPVQAKKKVRREAWDGISQSTDEASLSLRTNGEEQSLELPQTVVHVDEAEAEASRPEKEEERGDDMDVDESLPATVPHASYADESPSNGTTTSEQQSLRPAAIAQADQASSLDFAPRRRPDQPALFTRATDSASSSPSLTPARDEAAPRVTFDDKAGGKRLTDISDLQSSFEAPTQFDVAATQKEYDAEKLGSSLRSQDVSFDNAERWHNPFQHDTSTNSREQSTSTSRPLPGRELRRQPPPPSPVRDGKAPVTDELFPLEAIPFDTTVAGDETLQLPVPPADLDISTLPQPTQNQPIPESSPDVPLAKRPRFNSPVQESRASGSSSSHKQQTVSSNGFVPDSDGPTPPLTSTSKSVKPNQRRNPPLVAKQNGRTRQQAAEESVEEEDEEEAEEAPVRGKGKGRAAAKAAKPAASKPAPSRKGKERAAAPQESVDELDLLAETNYSVPPAPKTAKSTRTTRRAATATPASTKTADKGKRRASETPSVEPEPARKRRRSETSFIGVEIPSPAKSRTSTPKKVTKKAPAKPAATAKKARGGRTSTRSADMAVSPSPEPAAPVAGPSRLRFQSVEGDSSRQAASPAPTETRSTTSTGDRAPKSRLPDTAPFSRVLALWRDNCLFYPATVTAVSGGLFHVLFDDNSKGKLHPHEIRRCELSVGDLIYYRGDEVDTETQAQALDGEVRVLRVERDGEAVTGSLEADDIIIATSTRDEEGRVHRLRVEAVCVQPYRSQQLDDRRLTADELARFEGREGVVLQSLPLLKPPKPVESKPFERNQQSQRLFSRTAFIVTYASSKTTGGGPSQADREAFVEELEGHGATVIEWQHLFTVNAPAKSTDSPELFFPMIDFEEIEEVFLLADRACTTVKYLVALALGVPCLSREFPLQCIKECVRLDWRSFLLTSGHVQQLGTYGAGGQLRALLKQSFGLPSLVETFEKGGVFKDRSFLVVLKKAGKSKEEKASQNNHAYTLLSLLTCASARHVHFVSSPSDALSASGYDHVFLDDDSASLTLPNALKNHKGLVNIVWVKQCLMAGRLLPSARMREVQVEEQ
ncbi:Proteophosphoglycan ppg4 [Rhodotorula toruloides ATCC 204091]|uniref:BY PROTMAP: gi/342320560/gb/EGU12500.1/ Proteophosphoglycan ppg4 [Rhodotorula glutinis ATCC 204091] n=1 Tax=Rhodotorula toruloides TaxID=5286 RepID=A0A0K3CGV6_RHOTO|nr:Proteophosphoglycan ppg4 [Rhodotorula toruloides ATCC 204091]